MRERLAIGISVLAVAVVVGLSAVFARAQNPPVSDTPPESQLAATPVAEASDTARGRVVYEQNRCARCHSIAGVGSARYPLDGVGARRDTASLRAWTIGSTEVADSLSPAALRTKQGFAEIPAADLHALVEFLASLKEPD